METFRKNNETHMSDFDIREHFQELKVLDKGSVELNDGMITNPLLKIVNSARISFLSESQDLEDKDLRLIKFLMSHEHFSTFRHSYFTFRIKAPLIVFRQWWKYQIGSNWEEREEPEVGSIIIPETNWNEASGRYVKFEPEFYIPEEVRVQSRNNKQGSSGRLEKLSGGEDPVEFFEKCCLEQYENYKYMVESDAAKEQCRMMLPQGIYSSCYWTCSLQTILFFLHQRLKPDAQYEIRQYAGAIWELMKPMIGILSEESWEIRNA